MITAIVRKLNEYKQRRNFTKAQAKQIELVLTQSIEVFYE